MKTIKKIILFTFVVCMTTVSAQEKKIEFNKGVLRICSAKNFQISGYDGKEVVVKSLHDKRLNKYAYVVDGRLRRAASSKRNDTSKKGAWSIQPGVEFESVEQNSSNVRNHRGMVFYRNSNQKKGLKKLGKKNENRDLGIYFKIEQKDGELIFSDDIPSATGQLVMYGNESYEISIPNSIKLVWETNGCVMAKNSQNNASLKPIFYNSKVSSLTNFTGEVDIKSNLSNIKLVDVDGPVSINTIGGNVTVEFDKKKPSKLYSIYSNNGFIDVTLPESSSLLLNVTGESVYSDVDFKILEEKEENDFGHIKILMKLKKGSGKVRMNLDANYGEIYLRKKQ